MKRKILYIDLDNVLVDFPSGIEQLDPATKERYKDNLDEVPNIFSLMKPIDELRKELKKKKEASDLFGKKKDDGFKSSLLSIVQTFDGKYIYASIEEQAAHLLYFIIKNHSFVDGNKVLAPFYLYGSSRKINTALKNPVKKK